MRSPDTGFRKAAALEASVDSVFHVQERVVRIFVSGIEVGTLTVPRLFYGD